MTVLLGTYTPAHGGCAGAATPGAKALMSWHLGVYGKRGATNLGVYGCRVIGHTSIMSVHSDGRADDLGIPVGATWGQPYVDWLHDHSAELGIQQIIYRRRIWSCNHGVEWHDYDGESPHEEHAHVEVTPWGAVNLTVALLNAVAAGDDMPEPEIMVDVPGRGVFLSNYQTYRPIGADGEWQFHTDRGVKTEKVPESRLVRYGVPVGATVVMSDADVTRMAHVIVDELNNGGAEDAEEAIVTGVKRALREGVGTT